jgi:glutathione synthase/RimK-type ligase-like ATP-grasp enzyme
MNEKKPRIAINKNDKIFCHSGSWVNSWIEYCNDNGIFCETIDCYQPDIIDKLKDFDCLLWHIGNYVLQDMMIGRSILYAASNMGLKVFPDFNTSWHFDDKVAESYLLQSVGAPIPNCWMFYVLDDCKKWLDEDMNKYPLVAKLRCGAGSSNVKLLKNKVEAIEYSQIMFSRGFKTHPSLLLKAKSNLYSSKSWEMMVGRLKRIPEFLLTRSRGKMFPREKGYVFFQEFIPNDGYDLKIVVVNNKLGFIGRRIRTDDFRASGGGDLFFDKELITKDIISSAFSTSDRLGFQCMGYDYVVDKETGIGKIVEISYGFSHTALLKSGGFFDREGVWHDEPLNAPIEVIKNII